MEAIPVAYLEDQPSHDHLWLSISRSNTSHDATSHMTFHTINQLNLRGAELKVRWGRVLFVQGFNKFEGCIQQHPFADWTIRAECCI